LDTKSKRFKVFSKEFVIWMCFFIGISITVPMILGGISAIKDVGYTEILYSIKDVFKTNLKDTQVFKHQITIEFNLLANTLTDPKYLTKRYLPIGDPYSGYYGEITEASSAESSSKKLENEDPNDTTDIDDSEYFTRLERIQRRLLEEESNLIFYAENLKTGEKITNSTPDSKILVNNSPSMLQGYDYYLYFNGKDFIVENEGKKFNLYSENMQSGFGYQNLWFWGYFSDNISDKMPDLEECRIILMVKENLTSNHGRFYQIERRVLHDKLGLIFIAALFFIGLGILILSFVRRKQKHQFDKRLADILGKLWLEVKIMISFIMVWQFIYFEKASGIYIYEFFRSQDSIFNLITYIVVGWWVYFILIDMFLNRRKFFSHNSINSLIKSYKTFEDKKPFQKKMFLRLYMIIGTEAILVFLTGISSIAVANRGAGAPYFALLFIISVIAGVYLLYRYGRHYRQTILDIGTITDGIQFMKNGNINFDLDIKPGGDMYSMSQDLKDLQEGVNIAVNERMKSERTKVELITNVSHDLKTPLTSIISYTDLLAKEEGLPDHVKEHIAILQKKSERLKTLITDLFDLSKATTGEIAVDFEKLDLGKLVQQTLADLEEEISKSGLIFKVKIPEQPISIVSDGKKLYRVMANLISNTIKYSLLGSRVYIDVSLCEINEDNRNNKDSSNNKNSENGYEVNPVKAAVTIKNIANYEMNFDKDEVIERFVRGDKARSSEGSGLGLAIAQSFTKVCAGKLDIKIDGDLFKVTLSFTISE
jgi:signal transduction histidine kinase